jgi:peptidoglycan hydrolase-like protein with peptidoglycan-binding domain
MRPRQGGETSRAADQTEAPGASGESGRRRRLLPAGRYVVVLIVVWAIPILAAALLSSRGAPAVERRAVRTPPSKTVLVGERSDTLATDVRVTADRSPPLALASPATGTVTKISTSAGERIGDGDPLLAINGVTRVAQVGGVPFYRDLSLGMSGEDVQRLAALLRAKGYGDTVSAGSRSYDPAMSQAVATMQRDLGMPKADGTFRHAVSIYVSSDFGRLADFTVQLGSRTVEGTSVVHGSGRLTHMQLSVVGEGSPEILTARGPFHLTRAGVRVRVSSLSSPTPADLGEVLRLVPATAEEQAATASTTLVLDGVQVSLVTAARYGTVPRSSIITGPDGRSCVQVLDNPSARDGHPRSQLLKPGLPAGREIGTALVQADLIGRTILTFPSRAGETACT